MRLCFALALAAALTTGCKKSAAPESPDASMQAPRGPITVTHPETGFSMTAPDTWMKAQETDPALLADLRRPAPQGQPTLATPRIVAMIRKRDTAIDADKGIERELGELKDLDGKGALSIVRTARARRLIGSVDMGELRVDYRVSDPRGGADSSVVHRVWIGSRTGTDGKPWEVLIVLTYMSADEELVAREAEDVLRTVHFAL